MLLLLAHEVGLGLIAISLGFAGVAAVLGDFVADAYASDAHRGVEKATDAHAPAGRLSEAGLVLCGLVQVGIFRVVVLVCGVLRLCRLVLRLELIL